MVDAHLPLQIPFTHFLALSGAEFAGAFLGACLVFLHYLPHFNTLPEPPAATADDLLLRRWVFGKWQGLQSMGELLLLLGSAAT